MPKKAGTKVSLSDAHVMFGGDPRAGQLPTHSEGKDFGKGKGKGGLRDFEESRTEQNEWRTGGKDGGKGGFRRDQGESRADTGDWFAKDKGSRGGGGGGGDRDEDRGSRFGGGGGSNFQRRGGGGGGGEDTHAEKDSDWRGGMGRQRENDREDRGERRPFGGQGPRDRDRGERRGDDEWRGGREEAPAQGERPRLNLKPRTKPLVPGDAERTPGAARAEEEEDRRAAPRTRSDPFGAAKPISSREEPEASRGPSKSAEGSQPTPPWKNRKKPGEAGGAEDAEDAEDGEWATVGSKKGAAAPPAASKSQKAPQRSAREDSEAEESDSEEEEEEEDSKKGKAQAPATAKSGKWVPPSANKRLEEDDKQRRDEDRRRKDEDRPREKEKASSNRDAERKPAVTGNKSAGAYVPPGRRQAMDDQRRKEEEQQAKAREEEEKRQQQEEERLQAERERKKKAKEQKEQSKEETKAKKEQKAAASAKAPASAKGSQAATEQNQKANQKQGWSEESLQAFDEKCASLIDDDGASVDEAAEEASAMLSSAELRTVQPVSRLLQRLLRRCRGKSDEEVVETVKRFAPLLSSLISKAQVRRFKVKVLCETQRLASQMGLPRLSPASALIEVFFDGLYCAEVIEEDYFQMWALNNDDTPGKTDAMFQVDAFLTWLRNASVEGEESSEEEEEEGEDGSDESEEEESDIEKLVPHGAGDRLRG